MKQTGAPATTPKTKGPRPTTTHKTKGAPAPRTIQKGGPVPSKGPGFLPWKSLTGVWRAVLAPDGCRGRGLHALVLGCAGRGERGVLGAGLSTLVFTPPPRH